MIYKGYVARIDYSDEDQCFIGHIAGINDVIGYQWAVEAFKRAVRS